MSDEKQIEENGEEILYGGPREGGKRHAEKLREERRREMSEEQKRDELTEIIIKASEEWLKLYGRQHLHLEHKAEHIAAAVNNAGYRKQSEGEWVMSEWGDDAACSECGCDPYDFKEPLQNPEIAQYCPGCGAKMRGVNYGNLLTWDEMKGGA